MNRSERDMEIENTLRGIVGLLTSIGPDKREDMGVVQLYRRALRAIESKTVCCDHGIPVNLPCNLPGCQS